MRNLSCLGHVASVGGIALMLMSCGDDSSAGVKVSDTDNGASVPRDSGAPITNDSGAPIVALDSGTDSGAVVPVGRRMSDDYTLEVCDSTKPVPKLETFDLLPDCGDICGGGHCVPTVVARDIFSPSILPDCKDGMNSCIPRDIAKHQGNFKFQTCTSVADVETKGACLPACFGGTLAPFLFRDICGEGELCVPCVNPLDAQPTGVCSLLECPGEDGDGGSTDGG